MRVSILLLLLAFAGSVLPSTTLAQAPICNADGPYTGVVGEPLKFDGTGSVAMPPHVIILYAWLFGDGGTGSGPTPTHVYVIPGAYTITLTVTDDENLQSQCTTTAEISPATAVEPCTWGKIKTIYRD